MKYMIYARVSPRGSDYDRETSIPMQIEYCREYVKFHGGEVCGVRSDEFFSGKDTERPAFKEIMRELTSGQAEWDVLIVYKLSRMTRSLRDGTAVFAELFKYGKGFVSATENLDYSSPIGRLQLGIMQVFNQFEREQTAENTRNKMVSIAAKGEWPVGNPPFGYQRTAPKNNALAPHPENASKVQEIFADYLGDVHLYKIARKMHKTPQGILYILRNKTYTGVICYAGREYPGKHPALISDSVFKQVQERLAHALTDTEDKPPRIRPKMQKHQYLLTGLLRCHCGRYLTPASAKSGQYFYYRCTDNISCKKRFSADKLEQAVIEALKDIELDENETAGIEAAFREIITQRRKSVKPEIEIVNRDIRKLKSRQSKLKTLFLSDDLSPENRRFFGEELSKVNEQLAKLDGRKTYLESCEKSLNDELFRDDLEKIFHDMQQISCQASESENKLKIITFIEEIKIQEDGTIAITPRFEQAISSSIQKNGSGSWIRTSDQVVNSHLLYR